MLRTVGGCGSDVRVLVVARKLGISKGGVIVLDATYYHSEGVTFLWWLKTLFQRKKFCGSFSEEDLRNYFVPSRHYHSQMKNLFSSQIKCVQEYVSMFEKKMDFLYWGIILILSYPLIFILHPLSSMGILRRL